MAKNSDKLREQYNNEINNYNNQINKYKNYIGTANSICIYLESISKHLDAASDDLYGNVMISGMPYDRGDLAAYARKFDDIKSSFSNAATTLNNSKRECEAMVQYYQNLLNSLN